MKKLFLLLSLVLLTACGSGRINDNPSLHEETVAASRAENSVVLSLDTAFKGGKPLFIVLRKEAAMGVTGAFHVYTLKGNEVIEVQTTKVPGSEQSWRKYIMLDDEITGAAYLHITGLSDINIVEDIISNDLIGDDGLNRERAQRFLQRYPDPTVEVKIDPSKLKVKRDLSKIVRIDRLKKDIRQDDKIIASYKETRITNDGSGKDLTKYTIHFVRSIKPVCATVTMGTHSVTREANPEMEIVTSYDNKTHLVTIQKENITFDSLKQAVDYLIENLYL